MLIVSLIASVVAAKAVKAATPDRTTTPTWTYRHDHR